MTTAQTLSLQEQLDNITNDLVSRFFCRRIDQWTLSVIVYYTSQKDKILEKYPNLFVVTEHNLMNGSLQLDLQIK